MAVTPAGTPYVESSDLVANYPGTSLALANHIDGLDGGIVLQVVSATYSTQVNTTSSSYVTTGLTATITPAATDSKIIAIANTRGATNTTGLMVLYSLFRGTVAGTQIGSEISIYSNSGILNGAGIAIALDTPNTTSAQVYTLGMKLSGSGTGTAQYLSSSAVIMLVEVAA